MTTIATLIDRTRIDHLQGVDRHQLNVLDADVSAGATGLKMRYPVETGYAGSFVEVGDELCYVLNVSGQTLTVLREQLGSTAAAHTAGAVVTVDPRFPRTAILAAIAAEIRSWPYTLYQVATITVSLGSTVDTVDLAGMSDAIRLLEVQREALSGEEKWDRVEAQLLRDQDTAAFPSGFALRVVNAPFGVTKNLRVRYARRFTTTALATSTDLEATVGLSPSMLDIPPLGAAARLLASREATRANPIPHGQSRRDEAVPPRHIASAAEDLRRLRDQRISEEAMRLASDHGWHR